jgi:ribosomal protein RSM22 (predicted rRNA methylase)
LRVLAAPVALEDALYAAARGELGDAPLATAALVRAIVDRSARYTSERDRSASDPTGDLAARAVFFSVADAMKVAVPLGELTARGALPERALRVVDVGAGCGAMTLGMLASCNRELAVTAIDRDARALAIAKAAIGDRAALTVRVEDATRAKLPPADVVVIGTLLNELPADAALALVERALGAIADDGAVIVIEPALRETSRPLHTIRDAVIARGSGHVFAPCTRRIAPCPALADARDWCHEDRPLALPPRTAELARLTHLRDGGMKFSYLVLRRGPLDLVEDPASWRIVSAPMPAKGKLELYGCSAHGRVVLRLLKRNRSAANRAFDRVDRGDVVTIDTAHNGDRLEIVAVTRVAKV